MPYATLVMDLKQPLTLANVVDKFDVECTVAGGGFTGQAGAIRLGIARALLEAGIDRSTLKVAGMLSRDARSKELRKYGLKAVVGHHNSPNVKRISLQGLDYFQAFFICLDVILAIFVLGDLANSWC